METLNKGPHFWDEDHDIAWYTDVFRSTAQLVDQGAADEHGPLTIDASSNTFTVSGINVLGKGSKVSRSCICACTSAIHSASPKIG